MVAFDNSGPKDIIEHKKNGYLARLRHQKILADGIEWGFKFIEEEDRIVKCREKIMREFDYPVVSGKHEALYKGTSKNSKFKACKICKAGVY